MSDLRVLYEERGFAASTKKREEAVHLKSRRFSPSIREGKKREGNAPFSSGISEEK